MVHGAFIDPYAGGPAAPAAILQRILRPLPHPTRLPTMPAQILRILVTCALVRGLAHPVHSATNYGDEQFRLEHGHDGKDVFWAPTPDAMVTRMLQTAKVTPADIVYDLGAGEGRIPIAAARAFGARAVGIEYFGERTVAVEGRLAGATLRFDDARPGGTTATVTATVDGQRLVGQQKHPQATGSVRGERR